MFRNLGQALCWPLQLQRCVRGLSLLLVLALSSACYHYNQVPAGVTQQVLDLKVGELTQRYTVLGPVPVLGELSKKQPAVLLLHSGFSGDESVTSEMARALALRGMLVVMPAYRGQVRRADGKRSEGNIEFCDGEVEDAQAALDWLRRQPTVDITRLAVMGASHGGCISLRLAERNADLRAVVTLSTPVSAAQLVSYLQENPAGTFFYNGILAAQLKSYVKSAPGQDLSAYAERSPLFSADKLTMPLLVIHGANDSIVPVLHACFLKSALTDNGRIVREMWMNADGGLRDLATSPCVSKKPPSVAPIVAKQPQSSVAEFVFLQNQNHIYEKKYRKYVHDLVIEFLVREMH